MNGWFNPEGDASFRLLGCVVTSAMVDAQLVSAEDPVLQSTIADSDRQVPAKMVDLDSEQQLVSEIWGLNVRIVGVDASTLVSGEFEPAPFMDIWDRATSTTGSGGDVDASAMYQSVLTDVQWGDVSSSPSSRHCGRRRPATACLSSS